MDRYEDIRKRDLKDKIDELEAKLSELNGQFESKPIHPYDIPRKSYGTLPKGFGTNRWEEEQFDKIGGTLPKGFGKPKQTTLEGKTVRKGIKVKHLLIGLTLLLPFTILFVGLSGYDSTEPAIPEMKASVSMKGDLPEDYTIGTEYQPEAEHLRDECRIAEQFKNDYWLNNCQ